MRAPRVASLVVAGLCVGASASAWASDPEPAAPAGEAAPASPFADVKFEPGPVEGKLEGLATVKVPEGMLFIGGRDNLKKFIAATKNLSTNDEVGVVLPT